MAAKVEKNKCAQIISQNLQLDENVVSRILVLLDNDNTIPFIARYRKEHSGGLDPAVLRHIDGQYQLLKEVHKKAESTKKKIGDQLTIEIREALDNAQSVEEVDEIVSMSLLHFNIALSKSVWNIWVVTLIESAYYPGYQSLHRLLSSSDAKPPVLKNARLVPVPHG
ncbi:uncharacterized protein HI_0568 isoform X1 [Nematostella vectensis]|uniref:uncharacterized protein HI_0568 isoform X1 n=1 Tax=Nematostella vectensis TaxID=45351 RepID=UPI002076F2A9|nr:uncharacterized protein HI_0568 isoform X1 [Nematostella vectensis]